MVEKEKIFPPVYFLAVPAMLVLYSLPMFSALRYLGPAGVLAILLCLSVVSACMPLAGRQTRTFRALFNLACILAGVLSGLLCSLRISQERMPLRTLADPARVSSVDGILLSDPLPFGPSLYRVRMDVSGCHYSDGSSFTASGLRDLFLPAEEVRSSNPGGIARGNGKAVVYASGVEARFSGEFGTAAGASGETFFASGVVPGTVRWPLGAHRLRAGLRLSLMRILYGWGDAGGFLLALLSANRDYISPAVAADFRTTGLSHIIALSGMHLSLLGLVVIQAGKRIGGRRFSVRLSLLAMLFFVWFAGASPSLDRALLMALLLIAARTLGFRTEILPVLAATCVLQTMANPSDARSLAFMLSYGALWGILTFGSSLSALAERFLPFEPLNGPLSASVGAQLMTCPVLAVGIGSLSPIGIIASCIVSPLSSVFLVGGSLLAFVSALFPPLAHRCLPILDCMYRSITVPVRLFAAFPPLSLESPGATMAASILPLAVGLLLLYISAICLKRRSPDADFARL